MIENNHLKANPRKLHILLSTSKPEIVSTDVIAFAASFHEKLLAVTIGSKLKFDNHNTECLKVSKKNLTPSAAYQVPQQQKNAEH